MDPLAQIQSDLYYRLLSRKQLIDAGVAVQIMRPRQEADATAIISGINTILAGQVSDGGRCGLAMLLPLPAFEPEKPNLPSVMGQITQTVIVLENIAINEGPNGTGLSCEAAAILTSLAGHNFILSDSRRLTHSGMTPLKVDDQDFSADIAYEVTFKCPAGFRQEPECQMPSLTSDGDNLTVTSVAEDVVIYLTTDGSLPCEQNPAASPAYGTIDISTLPTGTLIRAVAIHDTINPSSPASYLVS